MPEVKISENDARFQFVLRALDSCKNIGEKLDYVDQVNSTLNETHLKGMIAEVNEVNLLLKNPYLTGQSYRTLLDQAPNFEAVFNITHRLDEAINVVEKFEQAIELFELIENINKNYGHEIPTIEVLYKRSERQRQYLISKICQSLEQMKNPSENEISNAVSHLIRCGNFSERDLKLKYLQARDNWFNTACEEQRSSFEHVVSVYSTGLPMIFNEYKSLFGDSSELVSNYKRPMAVSDPEKEDSAIINSWLLLKSSIFISSLSIYLKDISQNGVQTPTMIADTMDKCFQLTESLASIGFDFSSQLRPLFSKSLLDEVKGGIERATAKFEVIFTQIISKSIENLLLPVDDEITRISNMRPDEQLPNTIDNYPVFKVYFLHIIEALRWLQTSKKILTPIALCLPVYNALNISLTRVMKALAVIMNMENNSRHPILTNIATCLVTQILPFLASYCERLFPEKLILNSLGLSKSEFKSLSSSQPDNFKDFCLSLRSINEPLKNLLYCSQS